MFQEREIKKKINWSWNKPGMSTRCFCDTGALMLFLSFPFFSSSQSVAFFLAGSVFASLQAPLHYQAGTALTFYVAGLVYSYICALLVALCVEFPFVGLDKMLFSGRA